MYLNKVTLYGNLTRDPESKNTTNGTLVTSFGLATNRSFTKDGQKQEQTEFHNVVAFGKTAEVIAQYVKKGRPLYVEGRLQTRTWEKDGVNQYRTEIIVDSFQFGPNTESKKDDFADVKPEVQTGKKEMEEGKTYKPAALPDGMEYPDGDGINPEDIPF